MPPFNFDFFNVQGGGGQAPPLQWQASPGMADVSQIDDWINPLLTAKAKRDINVFQYGREIGAERGAEQNRLAQEIEIKRKLEDMMKQSGLGAEEGQDLDVTDPFSPEAQASRLRYQMQRQGSQDELSDAYKGMQTENLQSQIDKRRADEQFRREKLDSDQELKRLELDLKQKVAEGMMDIRTAQATLAQRKASFDERFKGRMMEHWGAQEALGQSGDRRRQEQLEFNIHKYNNPNLSAGAQKAMADLQTVKDIGEQLKAQHEGWYTGGAGLGTAAQWLNQTTGLGGQDAGSFYANQSKVRDRLINALSGAQVPEAEMRRVIQGLPTSDVADEVWTARLDATLNEAAMLIERYGQPKGPPNRFGAGSTSSASDIDNSQPLTVSDPQELYRIAPGTRVRTPKGTGVVMPGGKVKYDAR